MSTAIDRELEQLEARDSAAAVRFDPGPAFGDEVVVLPSAFNPPTLAHLELLFAARNATAATHALALLTTRNVDKGVYGAGLADRIGMLLAAREHSQPFAIGASNQARIMDQAEALRSAYPTTHFDFVVGFDTLERLFAPRYYTDMEAELEAFFAQHRVLAANRGETDPGEVQWWVSHHTGRFCDSIEVIEVGQRVANISSTEARVLAGTGEEPALLPPGVTTYIRARGLYRDISQIP